MEPEVISFRRKLDHTSTTKSPEGTQTFRAFCGLGVHPLDRSWERNCLPNVLDTAQPGGDAFYTHAESRMGNRAVLAQLQVPFEGILGQAFLVDARQQRVVVAHSF